MILVLITEAFYIRSILAYAAGGAICGAACYLGLIPFDPATMHFEGIVSKQLDAPYRSGRVKTWLKVKSSQSDSFVIAGFVPSTVDPKAVGALVLKPLVACGGTVRFRWPAPRTQRPQAEAKAVRR